MEKEHKYESGPSSVRELYSEVAIVSWESSSARGNNRSIRAAVETAHKWPEPSAASDVYASSSNPPNRPDEHNSPSSPINAAGLECTKCEQAGVHEKKCEIFQPTGSVLNDSSVSARLVGVSNSGFDKFGEDVCYSVRTEGREARSDESDQKQIRYAGLLHTQDTSSDASKCTGLLASSGNSESIYRSYVINQQASSKEVVACEFIAACDSGEPKHLRPGVEETPPAERVGYCHECERIDSDCCDSVNSGRCIVSSGLSDPEVITDRQTNAHSTSSVCRVNGVSPTGVLQARTGLSPDLISPSSDSGTESSENAQEECDQVVQCNYNSIKSSNSIVSQHNDFNHADYHIDNEENTCVLTSKTSTSSPIPTCEGGSNAQATLAESPEKVNETHDSGSSVCPRLQFPVQDLCSGGELHQDSVYSEHHERFDSHNLNIYSELEKIFDNIGSSFSEVGPNVESVDDVKLQRESRENTRLEQEDKRCVRFINHVGTTVESTHVVDKLHRRKPERIPPTNDGISLGCVSSVHAGAGERLIDSRHEFLSPVANGSCQSSHGSIEQTSNRIEVPPGVRRGLIQISRSLQKQQDRVKSVNEVKAVTHTKETRPRSKSFVESRKYGSENSTENSRNTRVKAGRQKKLNDSGSLLIPKSSCRVNGTTVKNTRESKVVPLKNSSSCYCTPNSKCQLHAVNTQSSSVTCSSADVCPSRHIYDGHINDLGNKLVFSGKSEQPRSNALTGHKRKVEVRQTRASLLRCNGQKTPDTTLTEDIHKSLSESSAVKELRDTAFAGGSSPSRGKPSRDRAHRSNTNVNRLSPRKPTVPAKIMANAEIISKRQALVKCQSGAEKQTVKVGKEVKSSDVGVDNVFDIVNIADSHVIPKENRNSAVRTDVAKIGQNQSRPQESKPSRQPKAGDVLSRTGLQQEKPCTYVSKGEDKPSLGRIKPPASAPRKAIINESPSTKKKLNTSDLSPTKKKLNILSLAVQTQSPLLSLEGSFNVPSQCNVDTATAPKLTVSATADNRCEAALNSTLYSQSSIQSTPSLKQVPSAPLSSKPANKHSLRATNKLQASYPSLSVRYNSSPSGRPKPSLSSRMKSNTGLSPDQKQSSKESTLSSSSTYSTIKRQTQRQLDDARVFSSTPLVQSRKIRPPSNLLETSKHQNSGQKDKKSTKVRRKDFEPSGASLSEDVPYTLETAQTVQCQNKVIEAAHYVGSSGDRSTMCDVHTDILPTPQHNTTTRRCIPRYSQQLIKDASKCDAQIEGKESVLKSILVNTGDQRLNGPADLPAVGVYKPSKAEDENCSDYSCDRGKGKETNPCNDPGISFNIEHESLTEVCGATLVLTELPEEKVLESIETEKMAGDADPIQKRTPEVSEVSTGEGRVVRMLGKTRQKVALTSKKSVKENENMKVQKQSPKLAEKQRKIATSGGHQLHSSKSHTKEALIAGLSKKTVVSYSLNGRKNNHSISTADAINKSQAVQTRDPLGKTVVPSKLKSEHSTGVQPAAEPSRRVNKIEPKPRTSVTRTQPRPNRRTESRSSGKPRVPVKSTTSALETSMGSCCESTASVLSSSTSSFLSCEQTTPETEDEKMFINQTLKRSNNHTLSHQPSYRNMRPTATSAVAVIVSVKKSSSASPHVSKSKTPSQNIVVLKEREDQKARTPKHKTNTDGREITQHKYVRKLQDHKTNAGKGERETDKKTLMKNKEGESKVSTRLVNGQALKKLPVLTDPLKNGVDGKENQESLTKCDPVLMGKKEDNVSDGLIEAVLNTQKADIRDTALNTQEADIRDTVLNTQEADIRDTELNTQETDNRDTALNTQEADIRDTELNTQEADIRDIELNTQEADIRDTALNTQEADIRDIELNTQEADIRNTELNTQEADIRDTVLNTQEADISANTDTHVQDAQFVGEENGSNAPGSHEIKRIASLVGLQELYACKTSKNGEPLLDVAYVMPAAVKDGTIDVLPSLTSSRVPCLADTGHQVPTLLHVPPTDKADRPQIAAEASECKQGVSRDTPIGGESAGELNALDIDSRERARSGSAQRKEASRGETDKKGEKTQTSVSYKRMQQDTGLPGISCSDIQYCDSCNGVLYPSSLLTTSGTSADNEETNQVVNFSTNGIHSHKDFCDFRCLDIAQNMSSVCELHFESTRNKFGLPVDNSSQEVHSRIRCHCVSTQKSNDAMTAVPGTEADFGVDSVFGLPAKDPEKYRQNSSRQSLRNMGAVLGSDDITTGVDIVRKSHQPEPTQPESTQPEPTQPEPTQPEPTQPEPTQPSVNVEVSSSADQVSVSVHVNGFTNDHNYRDAHAKFSHISGLVHTCQLADTLIAPATCDEGVGQDKVMATDVCELNDDKTEAREPTALSVDIETSFPSRHNTPRGFSDSFKAVGHERGNDVIDGDDVKQLDVSSHTFSDDTITSLLSSDESFYFTPVGHSFRQDTRKERNSQDSSKLGSIFSPVDNDEDILEYMDDSDDKNDTELSGSSDSSFHSATSDILTTTESTPERELASGEECDISTGGGEIHTFLTADSTCVPTDTFSDASLELHRQEDSYKIRFSRESVVREAVRSEEMSVNSTLSGCNISPNIETSLAKTSQLSGITTLCSLDTSTVSQALNTSCDMSLCSQTIASVAMFSKEVEIYQTKDTILEEIKAQPSPLTEKMTEIQHSCEDSSSHRNTFRERRSESCSALEPVCKLLDFPDAVQDLLSSETYVDNSTRDLAHRDSGSNSSLISASSFSQFSSTAFSSSPQQEVETKYCQRRHSEEKMPSFFSVRSLSVERKRLGQNKSKSLPRSRSSSTVTSSTISSTVTSSTISSTVIPSIVQSRFLTSSTFPPSTVISSVMPPSTITTPSTISSVMPPSTITSPSTISSTKASSTVASLVMTTSTIVSSTVMPYVMTLSPVMNSSLSEPQSLSQGQTQQHQPHRHTNTTSHCDQVNHPELLEETNQRHTCTVAIEDSLQTGSSQCSVRANNQLTSADKADSASDTHRRATDAESHTHRRTTHAASDTHSRTTHAASDTHRKTSHSASDTHRITTATASDTHRRATDAAEKRQEKDEVGDERRHVKTVPNHGSNKQLETKTNSLTNPSRPTSMFEMKDKKNEVRKKENLNTHIKNNTSPIRVDKQEQHIQNVYLANKPDNLTPCKQNLNSNINGIRRKSVGHGELTKQPNLTSQKHHVAESPSFHRPATDCNQESYLGENMERPLTSTGRRCNNSDKSLCEDTVTVSECTSTERFLHSVSDCTSTDVPSHSLSECTSTERSLRPVSQCTFTERSLHSVSECTSTERSLPQVRDCTSTDVSSHSLSECTSKERSLHSVSECTSTERHLHSVSECTSTERCLHSVSECTSTKFSSHSTSERTSTELSFHSSADTSTFKTSLFESGYSSDIKSPGVKSPGKEFMDNHRQAVYANHRQSVQTVSDNITFNADKGNKIAVSGSSSHQADLKCCILSKTTETTLVDNDIETACRHSLADLSPLSTKSVEGLGCEISHFIRGQSAKVREWEARGEESRGGYVEDLPHELSTLSRDNVDILSKSVSAVIEPDLDRETCGSFCSSGDFLCVGKFVNEINRTHQEQHSKCAHNEPFVGAKTRLQKHATPSMNAFSDKIAICEPLKLDMPNEYKHTSTRGDANDLVSFPSRIHVGTPNVTSSKNVTEIHTEPGVVDDKVSKPVDCEHLRVNNSNSEFLHCGCMVRNCDIYKRCMCAYTQHFPAQVSIGTSGNLDEGSYNVYSFGSMSEHRTPNSQVLAKVENMTKDNRKCSIDSVHVGCKFSSVISLSADHDKLNSSFISDSMTTELEQVSHGNCGKLISDRRSTSNRHTCGDCEYSGDEIGVRQVVDLNTDSLKSVVTCPCRRDVSRNSPRSGDIDSVNDSQLDGKVCDQDVRCLSPLAHDQDVKCLSPKSQVPDSRDICSSGDDVERGDSLHSDLYVIHYQAHLPHKEITDLSTVLSLDYNQELSADVSVSVNETVSHVTLPGPADDETINNVYQDIEHHESTDSGVTSCRNWGQQSHSVSDVSKTSQSPGDCNGQVPHVVYDVIIDVCDQNRQQSGDNFQQVFEKENIPSTEGDLQLISDKKQASLPRFSENIKMEKDVSKKASDGTREEMGASSNNPQCKTNNSLLTGEPKRSLLVRPLPSLLNLETRSRHEKSGSQTSGRRPSPHRCQGLPREPSPLIFERVCELLSKASANEQRNFIRPKSPLPSDDISRVTLSKNRPLTPVGKTRERQKRVIKKWRSVVEKSKALRKEKSITVTFLSPSESGPQMTPQISPNSLRPYKWERGDAGIWIKVYGGDDDSRDDQLTEHIDNGKDCTEWDSRSIFVHEPAACKITAPRGKNGSLHSNRPARNDVVKTVIEKSDTSISSSTTATNCLQIKISEQQTENCLQSFETLSNSEDGDNTFREDQAEDSKILAELKVEDFLDNKTASLISKLTDGRETNMRVLSPWTKAVAKTETTKLIQHAGNLHQNKVERKPAVEAAEGLKRVDKLEPKTRNHIWPTAEETLKRFQKSRTTVPSWEQFKSRQSQDRLDAHLKRKSSATEINKKLSDCGEQTAGTSGFSSANESSCQLITDTKGSCIQSERNSAISDEESHEDIATKAISNPHNVSPSIMSVSLDSKISAARNALSISVTGKNARPQTLERPEQTSGRLQDSVSDTLGKEERNASSCWAAPSASERSLPPSPIITLPPDCITARNYPQKLSPMATNSESRANIFTSEKVSISSNVSDPHDLSSSPDADSATPVVEVKSPDNLARKKHIPENNKQQNNRTWMSQPGKNQQKPLQPDAFQKVHTQSSLVVSSCCPRESPATSAVAGNTEMTAPAANLPDPTGEDTCQTGVRRQGPSTKLISVSVWDTHDGDKSLRNSRRLWASEDKHTLAEISETEEAHTVHGSIHGKASASQSEESGLLRINEDCGERVRASESPVRPQTNQKPCQRRSLSLPSGGLSYGDVKILYRDGHFVLVDTSADRSCRAAGETNGALDDVFEEAEGADQPVKDYSHKTKGAYHQSTKFSDGRVDDAVTQTQQTSLSFVSCDSGLNMRRCGLGGSIFSSLPRRKVHSQNSKSGDGTKMWRSQQSLMTQTERNRRKQKDKEEEEEEADVCRLGSGLRRNNSFTEAMGSTVIFTDRDPKRNHKVMKQIDTKNNAENKYHSCEKEELNDLQSRKSRSKSPGIIQRMLQKRKGTSSLSLSMSSLKPQNNDVSASSLSLTSSLSSSSLQNTSPGRSDSRDSSVGRRISFRGFFKRNNSADMPAKKNTSFESCSSPPLAAFLSSDDIGATDPSVVTHTMRGTRHGSFIGTDFVCAKEKETYTSYQRPRSSSTHVSEFSSHRSVYRSQSHDENNRSPIFAHTDTASRRARSVSERTAHGGRVLSEEQTLSRESSSEFDLSSPDPHNSDGTLTPRSTSPSAADLSGDQTLLASPVFSQQSSHMEEHSNKTSNRTRSRRTRPRGEQSFRRTYSAHGDSSLSMVTQRTDNGEIISSNSNDSGIQKDFSVNSSAESIQTAPVNLRGSHSPSPSTERPKSDSTVRWADWIEHTLQPWGGQHSQESNKKQKLPRATSETGGMYTTEHRRHALLNARSLGNITSAQLTARGARSASCCTPGSSTGDMRLLMHSRESLMNLVELRRPARDATSVQLAKLRRLSTPQPITVRTEKPKVRSARACNIPAVLVHAHSMPENLDKLTRKKNYFSLIDCDSQSITSQQSICDNSSDESEYSMDYHDEKSLSRRSSHVMLAAIDQMLEQENLTFAEALWDHVTMDPDELAFRAGDLISVTDGSDKHWWFGVLDGSEGWFPATFVRLRVNQEVAEEDMVFYLASDEALVISEAKVMSEQTGKAVATTGYQGMQQARANVVNEIISAEREYVKHLHDVIEGYVKQTRKRPEMFPIEKVTVIFSNIEDIYLFATELLAELDKSVIPEHPHLSQLGHCFLDKVRKFEMYSDYCNNHSAACEELREMYRNKRYRHFFEACRLLQEMIEIPLEGFLLTPVQKICKYHLQLAELLKFTAPDHPDFHQVQAALEAMKKIAMLINERKRKMESVEKLAAWQLLVDGWEGPDILDDSSELIYSGELNKINHAGWSQERYFFLFDHQLIYCKKDLLKKAGFCFKGRISMDTCEVINVADGREPQYNITVRNAWKLRDSHTDKSYLLVAKTTVAKQRWLKAFQDERKRVKDDTENNFNIPYHVKQAVITNFKQKITIQKPKGKGHLSRANTAEVISSINRVNAIATLPRTKNRHKVKSEGALDTGRKMKWFFFGKGKT